MQAATNASSTQILTQKIKLENEIKPHISVKDRITKILEQKVHTVSVYHDNSANSKQSVLKYPYCSNGFAAAIFHAYNHHQHLRLSPDDIWLTISQGVSRHINYNAEKFRKIFVQHEGKEEVTIFAGDILYINTQEKTLEGNWPEAVDRLVKETDKRVEKIDLAQLLECNFSTTTSSSLTASRIVLLDMVKAYFDYGIMLLCGIPKITLEGTLEDWTKLQEKVIKLRSLNLELDFWLDRLEPVIWKLVDTYRGNIDEEFWSKVISKEEYGSGGQEKITGWISAFFPYDRSGKALHSDSLDLDDIPDSIVEVPFATDVGFSLKFVAGFIGTNQEIIEDLGNESVVSPVIGWAIIDNVKDSNDS
ncbi:23914_t:CDS:1 [Dentiscutata erythropus]|uniref:23914_t:CDS:1 n=1 Tax=Dentiscutata erythropus TaxID=1348616 RepID=A0A9N9AU88_9GLOM|nr:23914_t:CDS:1 [Dentiscutata erythropus]